MTQSNILLLCDEAVRHIGTVNDHILAFQRYSPSRVVVLDSRAAAAIDLDLDLFDAIVFHYSIVISMKNFLSPAFFQRLAALKRPKILFIQDEYRWVDRTSAAIRDLGISVVFTVVNQDVIPQIYKEPWFDVVQFEQTLTGFVPEDLLSAQVPNYEARSVDVAYRARKVPSWLGAFGQEKWIIGEKFLSDSARYGLVCDISMSESSRIYGAAWIDFIAKSKAVLGTESGASFIDFAGNIQHEVEAYEHKHPDAPFSDIEKRFLNGDGQIIIHVISPRCFEAAALRTLLVLYPGSYSGILTAGRHYVELLRDHSNMDDVVNIIRDPAEAGKIIRSAYEEVAHSPAYTYKAFVAHFDAVLRNEISKCTPSLRIETAEQGVKVPPNSIEQRFTDWEQRSRHLTRSRIRAFAFALSMQRLTNRAGQLLREVLPEPLAEWLNRGGRTMLGAVKPFVIRVLVGHAD